MKYTEVNPFTGKNIDEDAPANATGPSVAGTGDDSSVVVVRKKKKKDTLYGIGFESDIELNNWKILQPTGVFNER